MNHAKPAADPAVFTTEASNKPNPRDVNATKNGMKNNKKMFALELKDGIRINVVSSGLVEDAVEKYETHFPGHNPIPMSKVINGYVKSVEGKGTGEIIKMYDNT